ncbi:MAG TPA: DEAD/DEAH box helicase [Gemmataceae bacterium]|nr:DEAD/DEAH box helicase [Gemmataceae bacterium]
MREVHKKRRHLPLRKLFAAIPTLLTRLKPCIMMSPLAVSTFLESPAFEFDLVIFDEASQVRPHDAVCAITRGRQLIVAGDQKQLPPTSFFERSLDGEDDATDDAGEGGLGLEDYESVLDVCCTLGLTRRRLRWHYRSRREPLIAFANREVYGNELVTFPSIHDLKDNPAVAFEYVAGGCWKTGGGGGFNEMEARRVAELVVEHFREHPEQSLGVIAFSQRQQVRILDELERLRRAAPELEGCFREGGDEPFFVKNLENVQGDERAVIFLSVGYGPDETGRVAMRFGPLNRQGGERRLNVAVTRARERMTVISSLRAQDIDLSRTKAEGVRLFRTYLVRVMGAMLRRWTVWQESVAQAQ